MTRIYDALRKAEPRRPAEPAPAPAPTPAQEPVSAWEAAPSEGVLVPLPLLGGVEMSEDAVRETTALRLNLENALAERVTRSVMFLSAQGGEGTSTVALQFAQTLAQNDARVLFVDAHAARPICYADDSQRYGLLDPHVASPSLAGVMTPNLSAIPATEEAVRTGIVSAPTIRSIIDAAVGQFDWVVIDGPPVVESPEAASLAAQVDGVVMVLHAGRITRCDGQGGGRGASRARRMTWGRPRCVRFGGR